MYLKRKLMKKIFLLTAFVLVFTYSISAKDIFSIVASKDSTVLDEAIASGADVNSRDSEGNTPLFAASLIGADEIITKLIDAGADVQARNIDGSSALHWAAKSAPVETLHLLIAAGADINPEDKYGITPAMLAAQSNLDPRVSELFIGAGAYESDDNSELLSLSIKSAVYNFNADVLRLYLPLACNINAFDILGQTMLMEAARYNSNEEVIALLLEEGSDINLSDSDGMTALLYAARYNHNPGVIEILIDEGAKVAVKDKEGFSTLDYAAENEYINRSAAFWAINDGMYNGF